MKKINLLELCLSPDLGGLELYVHRCARALGERMNVISVINARGKLKSYYENTPERYALLERRSVPLALLGVRELARIIDEHDIDVIHLHWTKDLPLAVMAKLLSRRKPSLVQSRHMMMTRFKNDPYHRFLYRHLDGMVAVTREVADQLERFIPGDIRPPVEVIYLGVEAVALPERSRVDAIRAELGMEGKFAVGMLGRINRPKGQHLLIEAIAMLDDPSIEAVFVGSEMEAGYIDALRGRAAELGVLQRVRFLGFMKEPSRFLQGCDVVVMASRCETFGLVLIEAMHAHTAVIGSDRCGVREIIDDGETGLMFASEDPRSLADQIARLKGDPALCARLAEAGYQKALERFESQHHFDRMAEYFRGLTQ